MYYEHFGLSAPPFRITPDTRLFYAGGNRGAILDAMVYAITSGEGITKVVGEVGSGKTMLCRMLELRVPEGVEVVYLANPSLAPEDILHAIAFELKLPVDRHTERFEVMRALQNYLVEKHAQGRQVVVFVEEAQGMPIATLEEIRLLSNLETQENKLLQIVLFGQPELEDNLAMPEIRQLKERITHSFSLTPLAADEILEYVNFRVRSAGYKGPDLFKKSAVKAIARHSSGLIRRVNILADKALLAAFAEGGHDVSSKHVDTAAQDTEFSPVRSQRRSMWRWFLPATAAALGGVALGLVFVQPATTAVPLAATPPEAKPTPRLSADTTAEAQPTITAAATAVAASPAVGEMPNDAPAPATIGAKQQPEDHPPTVATEAVDAPLPGAAVLPMVAAGATDVEPLPDEALDELSVVSKQPATEPVFATAVAEDANAEPVIDAVVDEANDADASTTLADSAVPVPEPMPAPPADAARVAAADVTRAGYLSQRLAETRRWLQRADKDHYSIQLMLIRRDRGHNLDRNLAHAGFADALDKVYVYETELKDQPLLSVLFEEYESFSAAESALAMLPQQFRDSGPFVRNIRDIQSRP